MKRLWILGIGFAALSACAQQVPPGATTGEYQQYRSERAARNAQLNGAPSRPVVIPELVAGGAAPAVSSTELAAAGIGGASAAPVFGGSSAAATSASLATGVNPRGIGIEAAPGNAAPAILSHPGISDEQDFEAVSGRETIESDAARRQRQAAAYEVINPGEVPVPVRTADAGPNIVQYALQTTNSKGQQVHGRLGLFAESRFQRNCARYRSPDEAQRDFLARGGPESDRLGVDPDGDGFACGWDPAPYRLAASS